MSETRIPIYRVFAGFETGEWVGPPEPTGKTTTHAAWCAKRDTSRTHYDTYEHDGQTRALIMRWVRG